MSGVELRSVGAVPAFVGQDRAVVRELVGRSTGVVSHSVAIIEHPVGMSTRDHHHTMADEVYLVQRGTGRIRVDGETRAVGPGDVVTIRPGQCHKLWADGVEDLVLFVTCAPAYDVGEVVWDE